MKNRNCFQYIAGACFLIACVLEGISCFQLQIFSNAYMSFAWRIEVLAPFIGPAVIALGLFICVPLVSAIGSGIMAMGPIMRLFFTILGRIRGISDVSFLRLADFLVMAYCILLIIAFWKTKKAKLLGMIAAGTVLAHLLIDYCSFGGFSPRLIIENIALLLGAIMVAFASVAKPMRAKKKALTVNASSASDRLERLEKLKNLLDNGAITQAEFDEKKKQILNI